VLGLGDELTLLGLGLGKKQSEPNLRYIALTTCV